MANPTPHTPDSPDEVDRRIVTELARQYQILNKDRFGGALKPPLVSLQKQLGRRAAWLRVKRAILVDEALAWHEPFGHVLDAMCQAMVHQFVDEVRCLSSEPAHTAAYLRECDARGISSGAHRRDTLDEEAQRALRRVMQLLALAESENQHEAELAMAEAQRLMLRHNLRLTEEMPRPGHDYDTRCLGQHKGRFTPAERVVSGILSQHFFVRRFWRWLYDPRNLKKGWVLEIYGTPTNVELASYVFDFLLRAADRLWREHRKARRLTNDKQKRSYQSGVMEGFQAKLNEERKQQQQQGLVWLGDLGLKDFDDRRYPNRRTMQQKVRPWDEARRDGWNDGKRLSLHVPLKGGQPGGAAPSALPPA